MKQWKVAAGGIACVLLITGRVQPVQAATYVAETPVAGIAITINNYNARLEAEPAYITGNEKEISMASAQESISGVTEAASSMYDNIAVSRVTDYVNVRDMPSTEGAVVGKIYDGCAATILATDGEWYEIESGSVKGYIKAEFFVTGDEAEALVPELATKYATVNATTLNVREDAGMDADVVATVPYGEEFVIIEEKDNWARMELDAAVSGWVSLDYLDTRVEFDTAISLEEEAQKEAEAQAAKERAEEAMKRAAEEERANREALEAAQKAEEEAKAKAAEKAKKEAEEKAKKEAEEKARKEAESIAEEESRKEAESIAEEESRREAESIAEEESRKEAESIAEEESRKEAESIAEEESRKEAESMAEESRKEAESAEEETQEETESDEFRETETLQEEVNSSEVETSTVYAPSSPKEESESIAAEEAERNNTPEAPKSDSQGPGAEEIETETEESEPETEKEESSNVTVSYSALREAIVAYSLQFVGNPYVYGGNSLTNGTDCSGFVKLIYQEFGYTLERRASYQYKYNGKKISTSQIQPGDLIFYGTSEVDHVALYIGDNKVVHASTAKTGIKISTLSYRDIYGAVSILD